MYFTNLSGIIYTVSSKGNMKSVALYLFFCEVSAELLSYYWLTRDPEKTGWGKKEKQLKNLKLNDFLRGSAHKNGSILWYTF